MMKLLKLIRLLKYQDSVLKYLGRWFSDTNTARMMQSLIIAIFSVHVIACFWFLSARFDDFSPSTWVYRKGLIDNTTFWQYSHSLSWAIQTLVTVGYGDYPARTYPELIMCLVWMAFGVNFYSFLVGSITSHVTSESQNQDNVKYKLKELDNYRVSTDMDSQLFNDINQFLQNNYNHYFGRQDEEKLQADLPPNLRDEVMMHQYGDLIDSIEMLKNCADTEFVWAMVQLA